MRINDSIKEYIDYLEDYLNSDESELNIYNNELNNIHKSLYELNPQIIHKQRKMSQKQYEGAANRSLCFWSNLHNCKIANNIDDYFIVNKFNISWELYNELSHIKQDSNLKLIKEVQEKIANYFGYTYYFFTHNYIYGVKEANKINIE